jgi:hypothetical protein
MHSPEEVHNALKTDATSVKILAKNIKHKEGDLVGARLNVNVLDNTKVPVMTIHHGGPKTDYKNNAGLFNGKAESYHHVVALKNAHFNVHQESREKIATKIENKHPMASVDGHFHSTEKHDFNGVEARFNPMHHHLFVDGDGRAVKSAEHVTLHGHRAYLRGKIEYHTKDTAPQRAGDAPSSVKLSEMFSESFSEYKNYFGE